MFVCDAVFAADVLVSNEGSLEQYRWALRGCAAVEGHVYLSLWTPGESPFENVKVIGGALVLYNVREQLPSLARIFPRLTTIRGRRLHEGYALLIFGTQLQQMGMPCKHAYSFTMSTRFHLCS